MHLTNFTDYGLRCLMYLTVRQGKPSTVKEIAEYYNISRNHLVKVTHRLSQLKLIESHKGRGGGIRLAPNAENLKLGDIVKMLESNMDLAECFDHTNNACKIANMCQLRHYLYEAGQSFINALNKYTLSDSAKTLEIKPLLQLISKKA
jgi:Rrf2 family nitric oxide-sensitive transcriptional repressor